MEVNAIVEMGGGGREGRGGHLRLDMTLEKEWRTAA